MTLTCVCVCVCAMGVQSGHDLDLCVQWVFKTGMSLVPVCVQWVFKAGITLVPVCAMGALVAWRSPGHGSHWS